MLVYILGGLRVAGAPPEAFAALLRAPIYVLWKFALALSGMVAGPARGGRVGPDGARAPRAGNAGSRNNASAAPPPALSLPASVSIAEAQGQ